MVAEMYEHDYAQFHKRPAWHMIGNVVDEALSPKENLPGAKMDWGIDQRTLFTQNAVGEFVPVPTHVANYRDDAEILLGVVSSDFCPVSNAEMADFCEALSENGDVKCESVGSIKNGKRVWFLLKGEPFNVANNDEIFPYILVSNGHDGKTSFRVTPTTIRVVCSNTMHMVIPRADTGELGKSAIAIYHTGSVMERVVEAQNALRHYGKAMQETKEVINTLANKEVNSEEVQKFFLECYTADFGDVPVNPQNKKEERRRERSMSAFNSFSRRFDDEKTISGTSLWNAYNAYSGLVQHDRKARGQDDADRIEKRVDSNLFGLNQARTHHALERAFTMAG